jgi:hypothetical protein
MADKKKETPKQLMKKVVAKKIKMISDMNRLQDYLETNKDFPEGSKQDSHTMDILQEKIDECLSLWHY